MTGTRVLITAPTDPVMTVAEVKRRLGLSGSGEDDLLAALVQAAADSLDAASGGWLGRALRPQVWELRLCGFPADRDRIELPFKPVTAVTSVKYDDADGVERTLVAGTGYRVFGLGTMGRVSVAKVYGGSWASARDDAESVRIRFTAGYPLSPADLLPEAIKSAIALGVNQLRATTGRDPYLTQRKVEGVGERRWTVSEEGSAVIRKAVDGLLAPYRVVDAL